MGKRKIIFLCIKCQPGSKNIYVHAHRYICTTTTGCTNFRNYDDKFCHTVKLLG